MKSTIRPRFAMRPPAEQPHPENKSSNARRVPHVITVTSGKGGVGKTNLAANLGWQLRQMRKRVLLLDADLGLANVDVLLGLNTEYNLSHVFEGRCKLEDILVKGPAGLRVLPAGSGVSSVTELTDENKLELLAQLESMQDDYDYLIIDSGAGISQNVIYFNLAAQTILVVVTPEPTSLTDAYALMKVLSREYQQTRYAVIANDVKNEAEGIEVFNKLTAVTDRFLDVAVDYVGYVQHDKHLREAVRMQKAFSEAFPESVASRCMHRIARTVNNIEYDPMRSDLGLLWRNLLPGSQPAGGATFNVA